MGAAAGHLEYQQIAQHSMQWIICSGSSALPPREDQRQLLGGNTMCVHRILLKWLGIALIGVFWAIAGPGGAAETQAPSPTQPWGLPPLPPGVGPVEKFADVSETPQGKFLEGGSFDDQGNLWFVAIGSGWI